MYGLDLFSGIGGITKALEGYVRPVAYCENDRHTQGVLLSRMATGDIPVAPIWDDVRSLQSSDLQIKPEIIYGGFPCQDISVAGRGAGLEGKRSGLFFEILRLAKEIKPTFLFFENVPAIRTRGLDVVVKELADIGYDSRWCALSAAEIGAPHERNRWFLLALCSDTNSSRREEHGMLKTALPKRPGKTVSGDKSLKKDANGAKQSSYVAESEFYSRHTWWETEPNVGRVAHGIPLRVDRLRALGNAVVSAQAREAFERLLGLKK